MSIRKHYYNQQQRIISLPEFAEFVSVNDQFFHLSEQPVDCFFQKQQKKSRSLIKIKIIVQYVIHGTAQS